MSSCIGLLRIERSPPKNPSPAPPQAQSAHAKRDSPTCLAGAWAAQGHNVHIVDLDSNKTVSRWLRDPDRYPEKITVASPNPDHLTDHLEQTIDALAPDVILIDVAGLYERALTHALARSHLTLIPASLTEADVFEAYRIAKHIGTLFKALKLEPHYRLVLNRVQSLSSAAALQATIETVRLKIPRLPTRIMQRAAYEEVGLSGTPPHFADRKRPTVAKAIEELDALRSDIDALFDAANQPIACQGAA